jgi:hypothetical protein
MRCIWNVKECMRPTRYEGVSECMLYTDFPEPGYNEIHLQNF